MKLELPDNNASVLFHMGNALQSIASDLDAAYNNQTPLRADVSGMTQDELSDTVDKMIESVAADWKVPVDRLTGNITDTDSIDDLAESIGIIRQQASDATVEVGDTIDADGLPWDQRIHSRGKTRLADNTWRMARKPNDKSDEEWAEYVEGVKAELKALMAIPVATGAELDVLVNIPVATAELPVELVTPPVVDATDVNGVEFRQLSGEIHNVEINGTLEFPPIVDSATFEAVANSDIGAGQPVRIVTPPVVEAPEVVTPPVDAAVVTPPIVEAPEVVTGPTTFPELMKFITVNNKKLTKESVDEALKAQGLASIALLAARTDLIPQVHAALVELL